MAKPKISIMMLLPPLLFAGLAALFYFGMARDNPNDLPSTRIGQQVPALTLTKLGDRAPFTDADLRAPGVKLVNFWASWCVPCRVEHPTLMALKAEGIKIYGVNYKDDPGKALKFLADLGNPFTELGADANGRTGIEWGTYGVPETFVIDSSGTILKRIAGPLTKGTLERDLRPAMAAAK